MAMALTSKTHPYKAGFEPFPSDVYSIPFAYCYRCSYSLKYPSCDVHCAKHIEDTFKRVVAAESVAAVIVEPIMGEGGFITPPPEFFPILSEICRKHGILLIADEVQTGFARTGAKFACERLGLEPDLVTMAKSLTGGLPMAAVTGRADIMDTPGVGQLGGTFGGNPAACEAALAVLDIIEKENLCGRADLLGERFRKRAAKWQSQWELVGEVRGLGRVLWQRHSPVDAACPDRRANGRGYGCARSRAGPRRRKERCADGPAGVVWDSSRSRKAASCQP